MNDEYTDMVREFLGGSHSEAVTWLQSGASGLRTLGEHQSQEESLSLVQRLYALGAESVIAVGYDSDDNSCRYLFVQMPTRGTNRQAIFGFERASVEEHGFDGTVDEGQEYLFIDVKNFG